MQRIDALVFLVLALAPAVASGQQTALSRGSYILAGDASLSSTTTDDSDRVTTIHLSPHIQYFVMPRLAVGGEFTFNRSSSDALTSTIYGIGPRVDYYFSTGSEKTHPFASVSFTFAHGEAESGLAQNSDFNSKSFTARGGLLLMLSGAVGITPHLYYQRGSSDFGGLADREVDTTGVGFALGVTAFVF